MEQKDERLEDWAANRKEHMKGMPFEERLKWYLTYYWVQTAVAVLAVAAAAYFIWIGTIGKKENWLNAAIINVMADAEVIDQIEEEFAVSQELNSKKQLVTLDSSYYLDVDSEELTQSNIGNLTKFQAYYTSGDMDLLIAPEKTCDFLEEREYTCQNLEEVLGKDFIAQFDEDQLRYMKDDSGNTFVSGISLKDTEFFREILPEEAGAAEETAYIGIPFTAEHVDHAEAFIKYVFQ